MTVDNFLCLSMRIIEHMLKDLVTLQSLANKKLYERKFTYVLFLFGGFIRN